MKRSAQQCLSEPAPPEWPVAKLALEMESYLHACGTQSFKLSLLLQSLGCNTAEDVRSLTSQAVDKAQASAGTDDFAMLALRICLGTVKAPFVFKNMKNPDRADSEEDADSMEEQPTQPHGGKKGGSMKEVAEIRLERRAPLTKANYFPPAAFDRHRIGSALRDEKELRLLIVQEVLGAACIILPDPS